MSTGAILGLSLLVVVIVWAVVEYRTLTDDVEGNHVTATIRRAWRSAPGVILLLMCALSYLGGHLFWCDCP